MNGFFQVLVGERATALNLYPPTKGGQAIDVLEVKEYLDGKGIEYDLIALNEAVKSAKKKTIILNQKKEYPIAEVMEVRVSEDKMKAYAKFYAPSNDGRVQSKEDILSSLRLKGIRYGIDEEAVENFVEKRRYCTDICVASGKDARQGSDASIEYFFDTENKVKPAMKEDGSVDFFNLGIIKTVKAGDVLAVLTPQDRGENGTNVLGENIKPKEVKNLTLESGENVKKSEDKLSLLAMVDGQVSLMGGKVHVASVLELEDVGTSTGNIDFVGSVRVKGNVAANFSVKAKGNIEVNGMVENAKLQADGDIIIASGMNGMGKGELIAGGRVIVKYLENTKVSAEDSVQAEAIIQSNISARKEIVVSGKKGYITGGQVTAGVKIEAKTLGSEMGSNTNVEVGVDPSVKKRLAELQKQCEEAQKTIQKTEPLLDALHKKMQSGIKLNPEQVQYFQNIVQNNKEAMKVLEDNMTEMCDLEVSVKDADAACIVVTGSVFPGVKITVSGASMTIHEPCKYSRFIKEAGDVKITAV